MLVRREENALFGLMIAGLSEGKEGCWWVARCGDPWFAQLQQRLGDLQECRGAMDLLNMREYLLQTLKEESREEKENQRGIPAKINHPYVVRVLVQRT
jgi:hypothetical protein